MNYDLSIIARLAADRQYAFRSSAALGQPGGHHPVPRHDDQPAATIIRDEPAETTLMGTPVAHLGGWISTSSRPRARRQRRRRGTRRVVQVPILPPSSLRITTVAGRGRPPNGQVLTVEGFVDTGHAELVVPERRRLARVLDVDEHRALIGRRDDAGDLAARGAR